jgi:hypothetical protein
MGSHSVYTPLFTLKPSVKPISRCILQYMQQLGRGSSVGKRRATDWTTQGSNPDRIRRIFPGKIHSMPSFGRGSRIICPMLVTSTTKRSKGQNGQKRSTMVQKNIPAGVKFFAHVQTGCGAHLASCTVGTGCFPSLKRLGRGVDHPHPSSAEVKERVELYFYFPSGSS